MNTYRRKILAVDDDRTNLTVIKNSLIDIYDVFTIPSGEKLFRLMEKVKPDLILLDVEMPQISGYDVIRTLKSSERTIEIPVIFLSGRIDPESEITGLALGAVDYITKPFPRELLRKRVELHLLLEEQKKELKRYSGNLEGVVFEKTHSVFKLQNAILRTVTDLVERRDETGGGHIKRTQCYLRLLINFMQKHGVYAKELSEWDIDLFIKSSQLHDVGKISIRDNILLKPGDLSEEEFEEVKRHADLGRQIMDNIADSMTDSAFLRHAKVLAATHHEKWDGSGYPLGLAGEDIALEGRIMAIVDVYDVLTHDRPYKEAYPHEQAVAVISEEIGGQFDPKICEIFLMYADEFTKVEIETSDKAAWDIPEDQLSALFNTVSNIVDIRDGLKGGQADRMRRYLKIFLEALLSHKKFRDEISTWDINIFLMSAQLHDIGKIAVSDTILGKTDKLTDDEFVSVKSHTDLGVKIIRQISEDMLDGSLLNHAEAMAGSHHERWDGTGYPRGLKGTEIPLQGRVMAIIDVYDALTNQRPHRDMFNHKDTVEIIANLSGTQFDPELVNVFLNNEEQFAFVRHPLAF